MTEKRFTIFGEWHKDCVIDEIRDNTGEYVTIGRVVDLLNENEQLKQTIETQNFNYDNAKSIIHDSENQIRNLKKENEQLKKELQRMYDVATLNKAIEVLENKYDKMLSDGSDEVKDAMRHTVLRCIEDLDELKDDITAR